MVVVLGHDAEAILKSMEQAGLSPRFVVNEQFESGQFSSVLAGLRAIDRPGVSAMLMTLVDVPLVSAATVRAVLERYRTTHAPVVRPVRGTLHGHPVLIDRSLFDEIRSADPQRGAKSIIRRTCRPPAMSRSRMKVPFPILIRRKNTNVSSTWERSLVISREEA